MTAVRARASLSHLAVTGTPGKSASPKTPWLPAAPLWLAAAVLLALAALSYFLGLGSSSLFVDEAFSWKVSSAPASDLYDQVKLSEVAPPGYYAVLDVWRRLGGSDSEAWMRALSALGGIGLVGAAMWVADMVGGRRALIPAGLLVALSPLVLRYAQEARAYVFVMLAVTLAAGAAFKAVDAGNSARRQAIWTVAAAAAAIAAVWLHYTSLLVLLPLAAWLVRDPRLSRRLKAAYLASVGLAQLAVTPLMVHQLSADNPGAASYAVLNANNALDVFGTPFDGHYPNDRGAVFVGGLAALVAAIVLWRGRSPHARVVAVLALVPLVLVTVITLVSTNVLITRYTAVAAPFALIAIAVAATASGRRLALVGVGVLAVIAALASISTHRASSNHPAIGAAFADAGRQWRPGDEMIVAPSYRLDLVAEPLTIYYAKRRLPPGTRVITRSSAEMIRQLAGQGRRLWIVVDAPAPRRDVAAAARTLGYRVAALHTYPGETRLQLTLLDPVGR